MSAVATEVGEKGGEEARREALAASLRGDSHEMGSLACDFVASQGLQGLLTTPSPHKTAQQPWVPTLGLLLDSSSHHGGKSQKWPPDRAGTC